MATVDEFWEFCTSIADGRTLTTTNQNQRFTLEKADGGGLIIQPRRGGQTRPLEKDELTEFWQHYIKSLSRHPASYNDITNNAAYLLTLVQLYMRQSHGVGL